MLYSILLFAIIIADQLSKLVVDAFDIHKVIIPDFFSIDNTRNTGAAFSFLADTSWGQMFFIVLSIIILIGLCLYFIFTKSDSKFQKISIVMIMGGAIGNLIDRIAFRYVRDFIHPHFFANFNVADIFVCVGAIMLFIFYLFIDEEAIFGKRKDKED